MSPFALHLSDQDMIDLASYYAYLPRLPAYHPAAALPLPRIVINGAPLRNIAPCGACHGALDNKVGSPWLEGQSAVYIKSQLEAFASGERRNDISRADAQRRAADDAGGNRRSGAILRLAALSRRAIGIALTFDRLGLPFLGSFDHIPLRERNELLDCAGYAALHPERPLEHVEMQGRSTTNAGYGSWCSMMRKRSHSFLVEAGGDQIGRALVVHDNPPFAPKRLANMSDGPVSEVLNKNEPCFAPPRTYNRLSRGATKRCCIFSQPTATTKPES